MQLKPLGSRVVVSPIKEETKGGIILPETADKEKPEKGKVIACGSGKLLDNGNRAPLEVKVGDTVVFKKYSPDEVKVEGKEYLILEESDMIAIIE
ncbi:MAG: 10 kDa chaperonin [Parcubacteria group bacterium GW2011_GWC2_45_7]|nr:MAG: 10 kDa chaperonin [Parcubacteria group bacterium GW2011_GWC2_45_7]KKU72925.1 MAG: 10 kDa chaperonin [Parcubacteria group bacterium GW2011_GWA2_47_26]